MNSPARSSALVAGDSGYAAGQMPAGDDDAGLSLLQLYVMVRSHWRLSAMISGAIMLTAALVIWQLPKVYSAKATLIFNYDNRDPLAGEEIPLGMLQSYVATQMELITSPVVLDVVVDRLKLMEDKELGGGFSGDDLARRDYVEKKLSTLVQIEEGRGGQLLYITVSSRRADRAAELANAVADVYLEVDQRRQSGPASERAERYAQQLSELRAKVAAAQTKVTDFRQRNGLTDVTAANSDLDMQSLAELQRRLVDAQNERRAVESKTSGEIATSEDALASKAVQGLKDQVALKEADLAQLSNSLGPQHPRIVDLQAQIVELKKQLAAALHVVAQSSSQRVRASRELEGKFNEALTRQRQKLLSIRQLQDEGGKLLLELESAQSVYKRALDGYDQIMFASAGKHANVSFIARAVPPSKPSKPSKIKLLLAVSYTHLTLPTIYSV